MIEEKENTIVKLMANFFAVFADKPELTAKIEKFSIRKAVSLSLTEVFLC